MTLSSQPHRVVLIDPYPLFRAGLEQACAQRAELEVVASVGAGLSGVAAVNACKPDVVVVDPDVRDLRGMPLLERLTQPSCAGSRVVLLSGDPDGSAVYQAFAAGAAGYLTRDAQADVVCDALLAAARGDTVISPTLHRLIATEIRLHASGADAMLSSREREVLGLVAQGYSTPEIARRLYISHTTVKSHLANVYGKLGVSNRAAAVAQAMKRGLVDATNETHAQTPVPSVRLASPAA